jgi:hypothetical protein
MNCVELVEQLTDYLEGALRWDSWTRLDDHLQGCVGCDAYLGEVRVTLRVMSRLPAEPMSAELESRLLARYREWTDNGNP